MAYNLAQIYSVNPLFCFIKYKNTLNKSRITAPISACLSRGLTVIELVVFILAISILSTVTVLGLMHDKEKALLKSC